MGRTTEYLRRNWGAPFVTIFILLLLVAAGELSYGSEALANGLAVYAFYFLVAGVVLQIASYVKFRNEPEQLPQAEPEPRASPRPPRFSRRTRVIMAVAIIALLGGAAATVALEYGSTHGFNSLSVSVDYVDVLSEPGGAVVVAFAVSASGGAAPYGYSAQWPDGQVQSSTTGAFSRTFAAVAIPGSVLVTVVSSDGQKATKSVPIPAPASTTLTSSSSVTTASSLQSTTSSSQGNPSGMTLSVGFTKELSEPGGNTTLLFGVSVLGGQAPYNFVARWADGVVQSDGTGSFSRTFTSGETVPASVLVVVISGNGQSAKVNVTFSSGG
ncbi:MAG: hypothetical protein JRN09_03505 [Nitrososphaerota archaeon]|nr:hypothetical protein [Nitrososphaerota archaeon]